MITNLEVDQVLFQVNYFQDKREALTMEWINSLGNMDNTIYGICIMNSYLTLYIKMWDDSIKKSNFQIIMLSKKRIL